MPNGVAVQYVGGLKLQEEKNPKYQNETKKPKPKKLTMAFFSEFSLLTISSEELLTDSNHNSY